jgi:hypothetical protein
MTDPRRSGRPVPYNWADAGPVDQEIQELMAKPELDDAEAMRLHLLTQPPPPPRRLPRWIRRLIRKATR